MSAAMHNVTAATRTAKGKSEVRRLRGTGQVPAVAYGKDLAATMLSVTPKDIVTILKSERGQNTVLKMTVTGGKDMLVMIKDYTYHPVTRSLEHIDFVEVKKGEKVIVDVPVQLIGEAKSDALVVTEQATLSIEAEATHIPELLEISIEGLEAGTQILASDVELPKGSTLLTDEDALIVNVTHAPTAEEVEAELAEAEADNAGEPAQPAVVGEDSSEE